MGIAYADDTITVTGGSEADPFTMDDLNSDGTVGGYITPAGYGNKVYSVSKDLVIGSDDADTFFDLSGTIIEMDNGKYLEVYSSALRGGNMGETWGAKYTNTPLTNEDLMKLPIQNVRKLYIEEEYRLGASGAWPSVRSSIVAVRSGLDVT